QRTDQATERNAHDRLCARLVASLPSRSSLADCCRVWSLQHNVSECTANIYEPLRTPEKALPSVSATGEILNHAALCDLHLSDAFRRVSAAPDKTRLAVGDAGAHSDDIAIRQGGHRVVLRSSRARINNNEIGIVAWRNEP